MAPVNPFTADGGGFFIMEAIDPTNETIQEAEEPTLLDICKTKEEAGMQITRNWAALWQQSLRYFLSDQLHGVKQHKDWDWVIVNYLWPAIWQEIAKLTKDYKLIVGGLEPSDTESAEAWQGFLNWQWKKGLHRQGMQIEQLKAMLHGKLYGYRISKIYWDGKVRWDAQQRRWMGEVRHRLWNPAHFWASDTEYVEDGDCGTVRWVEENYAVSQWPEFEAELRANAKSYPDMITGGGEHVAGQTSASGTYPSAGTGGIDRGPFYSQSNVYVDLVLSADRKEMGSRPYDKRKYCKISECYLKNYTETEQAEQVEVPAQQLLAMGAIAGGPNGEFLKSDGTGITPDEWPVVENKWMEPRFPKGQYIVRCEDVILNPNEQDQVYPHSVWPFIVIPHYLLPFMWQGTDAITLYRHTQDHINVTVSHLVNNMKQFGDPKIAIEKGAQDIPPGSRKKAFTIFKGAGSIIRLARGGLSKFKVLDPVAPSASALQLYGLFSQEYKNLVGLQDIAQGKRTGNMTATEAQFLAISANDRITLQNVFENQWVRQVASLVSEMDQKYYDAGRFVRIVGEDQNLGISQITEHLKDVEFDIDIEPGMNLPFDEEKRIKKYEMAYNLLSNPNPNPLLPDMLRVLGIPTWQKVLKKHVIWQKFVAFEQVYNATKEGKITPQDAVQFLVQQAMREFQTESANMIPTGQEGGRDIA